ncbi:hypothetical protein AWB80_01977 [Caballeronia pedi]|uniref:DUF3592 domain-containing protein n=1 Tax=Caballeronia pedi TaxID=1777141 RepID=A0A158A9T0_9BURK|nr:DUF3592 domain-containing protein [Caballeronia pedi]SAK54356.1 hypothetical protein AWB80_01977 [Caballeronia pedi]
MFKIDRSKINWDAIFVGCFCFVLQLPFLPSTLEFRLYSVVTYGTVVKLNAGGFHPEIEFTTSDGERVSFAGSTTVHTEVGDRVEIRYRLKDPYGAEVNNELSVWGIHTFLTAMAALFIIGGLYGMPLSRNWRGGSDD